MFREAHCRRSNRPAESGRDTATGPRRRFEMTGVAGRHVTVWPDQSANCSASSSLARCSAHGGRRRGERRGFGGCRFGDRRSHRLQPRLEPFVDQFEIAWSERDHPPRRLAAAWLRGGGTGDTERLAQPDPRHLQIRFELRCVATHARPTRPATPAGVSRLRSERRIATANNRSPSSTSASMRR
jgi:hypothetical protein